MARTMTEKQRDDLLATLESIMEWTATESDHIPIERREMLIRNAARAAIAKTKRGQPYNHTPQEREQKCT